MAAAQQKLNLDGSVTTTSNTITNIKTYTLSSNTVNSLRGELLGRKVSNGEAYVASFTSVMKRTSSGTSLLTTIDLFPPVRDTGMLTASYTIDLDGNDLRIRVQGPQDVEVDWFVVATLRVD